MLSFFKKNKISILYLSISIALAIIIRIYSLYNNPVINPDGANCYIQQAKSIYYGKFDSISSCYSYLSLYPILVAFFYKIIHNWVLSGQLTSLFFSILSFCPLYFLCKKFFNEKISFIILIIWACIPSYAVLSYYVIRGPVYWFFALTGLYFFISYLEKKYFYHLVLSLISFLLGAWCRVECLTYFFISILLSIIINKNRIKILFSITILFFIITTFLIIISLYLNISVLDILPYKKIVIRIKYLIYNYKSLREILKKFEDWDTGFGFNYFFINTKNLLWWVALGALITSMAKAFYLPFFVITLIGIYLAKQSLKKDIKVNFLFLCFICGLIILYLQTLYDWAITNRYIVLILFPSFIFMGYVIDAFIKFIANNFSKISQFSIILFCIIIFLVTFPQNFLKTKNPDKIIYRKIGYKISKIDKQNKIIRVGSSIKRTNIIYFYANINFPGPVCFPSELRISSKELSTNLLINRNIDYYVATSSDLKKINTSTGYKLYLKKLYTFNTKKHGPLILLKIEE